MEVWKTETLMSTVILMLSVTISQGPMTSGFSGVQTGSDDIDERSGEVLSLPRSSFFIFSIIY